MPVTAAPAHRLTFRKKERLCSRKVIQEIVQKGKSIHLSPIRLTWLKIKLPHDVPAQAAFVVPKKNFKSAVDRNRIKRKMRESYRKNKSAFYPLISFQDCQYAMLFVYTGTETVSYSETEEKTKIILHRLAETIQKNNG